MIQKIIWHLLGLSFAITLGYCAYWIWGNIPSLTKGTSFNDLRIVIALVAAFLVLSLGEALWAFGSRITAARPRQKQ